ncbi:hypothetical protein LJR166_003838 [Acidovorax delafieldii]
MSTIASVLAYVAFGTLVLLCVGTSAMALLLRRRYPLVWEHWGEPEAWIWLRRTSPGNHVLTFLQERSYAQTGDEGFVRFCEVLRYGWYVGLVLLPIAAISLGIALIGGY